MIDPVRDRQRARVALRLLPPTERHILTVLGNLQNMSVEEVAEEMVVRYGGDFNSYRTAVIERETAKASKGEGRKPWHRLSQINQSRLLVLDVLRRGEIP